MSTLRYFTRTAHLLRSFNFRTKNDKEINTVSELIHPRLTATTDNLARKRASNSLLHLMYSEENEALFI